jgi:hypothetical protein
MNLCPCVEASRRPVATPQAACKRKGDAGYPGQVLRGAKGPGAVSELDNAASPCRADTGKSVEVGGAARVEEVGAREGGRRDGSARGRERIVGEDAARRGCTTRLPRGRRLGAEGYAAPVLPPGVGQLRRMGRHAPEGDVRRDPRQQPGPDARYAVQASQGAEWAMLLAIVGDSPGEARAYPRQPAQLLKSRQVGIDPLTLGERSGELRETVAPRESGMGRPCTKDGDGTGRGTAGCKRRSRPVAGDGKADEQEDGTAFGRHGAPRWMVVEPGVGSDRRGAARKGARERKRSRPTSLPPVG